MHKVAQEILISPRALPYVVGSVLLLAPTPRCRMSCLFMRCVLSCARRPAQSWYVVNVNVDLVSRAVIAYRLVCDGSVPAQLRRF